jgi:hypothetical protein
MPCCLETFATCFDPNWWSMKNSLLGWGLNPRPIGHESSALTRRPVYHSYSPWALGFLSWLILDQTQLANTLRGNIWKLLF